jgi:hypothetical protein
MTPSEKLAKRMGLKTSDLQDIARRARKRNIAAMAKGPRPLTAKGRGQMKRLDAKAASSSRSRSR